MDRSLPPRRRQALTHVGGTVEHQGDPDEARELEAALLVESDEHETRAHVHGFHSYTARMHPVTARRLVRAWAPDRGTVLDPFCGSGTVLVEARLAGRRALGVDANPLAVELARLKTRRWPQADLERLVVSAHAIVEVADERRLAKAGATRAYGPADRELFDPHVLLELDGVRDGIERQPRSPVRDALWLALSSILVKVSRQPGDSAERRETRRIASGFALRMYRKRVEELARQLDAFTRLAPSSVPECVVALGDARELAGVAPRSVDLVVTSPPYPGVYDYFEQHAPRLRWLGFDPGHFATHEIGSRRELQRLGARAEVRWREDFGRVLAAIGRVLAPTGAAVLLIADSAIEREPLYADDIARELAPAASLRLAAVASQVRPHFHGPTRRAFRTKPRREHALLLRAAPPPKDGRR